MFILLSILMMLGALLGAWGERAALELPTVRFPFRLSREIEWLHHVGADGEVLPWFGWLFTGLVFLLGLTLFFKASFGRNVSPLTERRIARFKSIRRGYYSLWIIIALAGLAALDHVLVGKEALAVKYEGEWTFPAFTRALEKGSDYGLEGDAALSAPDYRQLKRQFREADAGNRVILPLHPYAPTNDRVAAVALPLKEEDGRLQRGGENYNGLAARVFDLHQPEHRFLQYRYREGLRDGPADGWDRAGKRVYQANFEAGQLVPGSEKWTGEGELADFLGQEASELVIVDFSPSGISFKEGNFHPLGTTSQGYDVLAYLYGGLQVNFKAVLFYIPLVYAAGITIGLLMGYFGSWFDLVVQRLIEVLEQMPFLFIVMIASTAVPERLKEKAGLWLIVIILAAFGWMSMTYLMRTAALKEKARDYIAASRVIGASTPRILFRHLLPNSVAIIVTLVPFSVSGLISALTSLDYLGFGLPAKYATWGQLLQDGLSNTSSPWLVTSAFACLVGLLVLVTFVGEAVREAFDPKKFSYYQ
ncbi:MAG: ABC transporter permease subunit [Verrucomicrobiales bacterium]